MKEFERGNRTLIIALFAIIAVLVLVILYAFILRPSLSGYAVQLQNEGANYAVGYIISQVQQQGYVQIPVGNQTLILVPYVPQNTSVSLNG